MVSNCGCAGTNNGAYVDWSDGVSKYGPSYNYSGSMPAVYDNMSYNGSVFDNSTFANTYSGMNGLGCLGSYGFGYGMMPYGLYGGNNQSYYDWMYQNQQFNMDYNKRAVTGQRENELEINGPQDLVNRKLAILKSKIQSDDQRHIKKAFEEYCAAFSELYPQFKGNQAILAARAIEYYEADGKVRTNNPYFTLTGEMQQYAKPIFVRKLVNTATCGMFMKGSAEETAQELTGSPMTDRAQNHAAMGKAAGVITGLGTALGIFKGRKVIWKAAKAHPAVALVLAAGAAVGLISSAKGD